jgi:FkbM family methyltransferase
MERVEFKKLLDNIADGSGYLRELRELVAKGPTRNLEVRNDGIILHHHDLACSFVWEPEDPRTAVASLVAIGEYEPIETNILSIIAARSFVTLDIGANVGYYAVVLGLVAQPQGRVYSFEPLKSTYAQLVKNIAVNNLEQRVMALQIALSDTDGVAELHVPQISGTSATSMRQLHPEELNNAVKIETRRLDDIVDELAIPKIDLLKIDVEGAEWLVFQGGWKTVERDRPVIFAELLRKWSAGFGYHPNEVVVALAALGYKCFGVASPLVQIDQINESTIETNFLFLTDSDEHRSLLALLHDDEANP